MHLKELKQNLEEIFAHPHLLQHYSQQSRSRSNPYIYMDRRMDKENVVYTQWNVTQS